MSPLQSCRKVFLWRRRSGFTLLEAMISISITGMAMAAVVALQYWSARTAKEIYGQTRTRSSRMIALDQIRYRLANGNIDTCTVTNGNRTISYQDAITRDTCRFRYNPDSRTLFFDNNVDDMVTEKAVARGPIDITFEVLDADAIDKALVRINVRSASEMAYGDVDTQDGTTNIYLRNRL